MEETNTSTEQTQQTQANQQSDFLKDPEIEKKDIRFVTISYVLLFLFFCIPAVWSFICGIIAYWLADERKKDMENPNPFILSHYNHIRATIISFFKWFVVVFVLLIIGSFFAFSETVAMLDDFEQLSASALFIFLIASLTILQIYGFCRSLKGVYYFFSEKTIQTKN